MPQDGSLYPYNPDRSSLIHRGRPLEPLPPEMGRRDDEIFIDSLPSFSLFPTEPQLPEKIIDPSNIKKEDDLSVEGLSPIDIIDGEFRESYQDEKNFHLLSELEKIYEARLSENITPEMRDRILAQYESERKLLSKNLAITSLQDLEQLYMERLSLITDPVERDRVFKQYQLEKVQLQNLNATDLNGEQIIDQHWADLPKRDWSELPKIDESGKYGFLKNLGAGGMGSVDLVWDAHLMKPVVAKTLHDKWLAKRAKGGGFAGKMLRNFLREKLLMSLLSGEHTAKILDVVDKGKGQFAIIMDYVPGMDLGNMIDEREFKNIRELDVFVGLSMVEILSALHEMHSKGMNHRDIKPANIMITRDELKDEDSSKLLDFGLARIAESSSAGAPLSPAGIKKLHTITVHTTRGEKGNTVGSPLFMSPEQMMGGDFDYARSDLWSLAATYYVTLTKHSPFGDVVARPSKTDNLALLHKKMDDKNIIRPSDWIREEHLVGESPDGMVSILDPIIMKQLHANPAERIGSAKEMAELVLGALLYSYPHIDERKIIKLKREFGDGKRSTEDLINQYLEWLEKEKMESQNEKDSERIAA